MDIQDYLSEDGQVVLALCSALGLDDADPASPQPLRLSEWNEVARRIETSVLARPAALHGRTEEQLAHELGLIADDAERICRLLGRLGRLSLELEGLLARGIWVVTRMDERYAARLRDVLKHQAPSVLFGAGNIEMISRGGVAIVGSRNLDEAGMAYAREAGRKCASAKLAVVSGGARGTDRLAMEGALEAGGQTLGVLADSLERTIRQPDLRELMLDGRLLLLTPHAPAVGFSIGAAMGRNKVIYGLADFALVVSSDYQSGGTWAGATEALKAGWCPVFVRDGPDVPKGNRELLKLGAIPLPQSELAGTENLGSWLKAHCGRPRSR